MDDLNAMSQLNCMYLGLRHLGLLLLMSDYIINSNQIKQILPETNFIINGYMRTWGLSLQINNIPQLINFLIKKYYQQRDNFSITSDYKLFNNNQTAMRKWDRYHDGNNLIWSRICGSNIINYNEEKLSVDFNIKFKWNIRIDHCPYQWDIGLIDKSRLTMNNEPCAGVPFTAMYGMDEAGFAKYIQDPPSDWMKPTLGLWHHESNKSITTGAVITIELYITNSTGKIKILIDDVHAVEYPWVYNEGKYGLYIVMKEAEGKFSIINYQCVQC